MNLPMVMEEVKLGRAVHQARVLVDKIQGEPKRALAKHVELFELL